MESKACNIRIESFNISKLPNFKEDEFLFRHACMHGLLDHDKLKSFDLETYIDPVEDKSIYLGLITEGPIICRVSMTLENDSWMGHLTTIINILMNTKDMLDEEFKNTTTHPLRAQLVNILFKEKNFLDFSTPTIIEKLKERLMTDQFPILNDILNLISSGKKEDIPTYEMTNRILSIVKLEINSIAEMKVPDLTCAIDIKMS